MMYLTCIYNILSFVFPILFDVHISVHVREMKTNQAILTCLFFNLPLYDIYKIVWFISLFDFNMFVFIIFIKIILHETYRIFSLGHCQCDGYTVHNITLEQIHQAIPVHETLLKLFSKYPNVLKNPSLSIFAQIVRMLWVGQTIQMIFYKLNKCLNIILIKLQNMESQMTE